MFALAALICTLFTEPKPLADNLPTGAWTVQETSMNLTVVDRKQVAHGPQDCFLLFCESRIILLFRITTSEFSETEGVMWKISAYDQKGPDAIGYVQRPLQSGRQKLTMHLNGDDQLDVNMVDDGPRADGEIRRHHFACKRNNQEEAKQKIQDILKTQGLRMDPVAQELIRKWLEKTNHDQATKAPN